MQKTAILIGMIMGSTIGGYVPVFFGVGVFSVTSIITSAVGGFLGIYAGYAISKDY